MPVLYCKKCGKKSRAPEEAVGKNGKCPACGELREIPAQDDPLPSVAECPVQVPSLPDLPPGKVEPPPFPSSTVNTPIDAGNDDSLSFPSPSRTYFLFNLVYAIAVVAGIFAFIGLSVLSGLVMMSALIPAMGCMVSVIVLFYRMWKVIPESKRTISPAKAVGLSLVPIFNFYWLFRSVYGLSLITKNMRPDNNKAALVATRLALVFCVLIVAPFVAFLVGLDFPNDLNLEFLLLWTAIAVGGTWLYFQDQALRYFLGIEPNRRSRNGLVVFLIILFLSVPHALWVSYSVLSAERAKIAEDIAESCSAFVATETMYARRDYDRNGVLEYAMTMRMLYETRPGAADVQLITSQFARAEGQPSEIPIPFKGYRFKVLTGQGEHAQGGAMSFIDANGNMTRGYAFIAYPANYVRSGRETFLVSHHGIIYKADLGRRTDEIVENLSKFNPDPKVWQFYRNVTPLDELQP
jgi:hypothetical protein